MPLNALTAAVLLLTKLPQLHPLLCFKALQLLNHPCMLGTHTPLTPVVLGLVLTYTPPPRILDLQLLNHPWINTYRARRSMRSININTTTSPTTKTAAGEPAAAAAGAGAGAAAAAAAGISHAHSLTMPPTPGSNLAGSAQAAGNFFSGQWSALKPNNIPF
jgi:hypothetical protein